MIVTDEPSGSADLATDLRAAHDAGLFRYRRLDPRTGEYTVDIQHPLTGWHTRRYGHDQMRAWLDGFTARRNAGPLPDDPPDLSPVGELRRVLVRPSISDALRSEVRYALEASGTTLTMEQIAAQLGIRSVKTLREALRWGREPAQRGQKTPPITELAGQIMAIIGWDEPLHLPAPGAALTEAQHARLRTPDVSAAAPEESGIARMRAFVIAHERRWLDYEQPTDPNDARRAPEFVVTIAGGQHRLPGAAALPWLIGVGDACAEVGHIITPSVKI